MLFDNAKIAILLFPGLLIARFLRTLRADDDEFLGFRHLFAAFRRHADAVEIDAGLQAMSAIDVEVPCERVGRVGRYAAFRVVPELASARVENVEFHIHRTARAVVVDDESGACASRILRTTHVEKGR